MIKILNEINFSLTCVWNSVAEMIQPFNSQHWIVLYQNTDDGQNPLLKQCSKANFLSAEVSTSL